MKEHFKTCFFFFFTKHKNKASYVTRGEQINKAEWKDMGPTYPLSYYALVTLFITELVREASGNYSVRSDLEISGVGRINEKMIQIKS